MIYVLESFWRKAVIVLIGRKSPVRQYWHPAGQDFPGGEEKTDRTATLASSMRMGLIFGLKSAEAFSASVIRYLKSIMWPSAVCLMLNGLTPHFLSICAVAVNSGVSISAPSA